MAFTKITAAGIGTTESVTLDGLSVINNGSFGGNLTVGGVLTYEDVTNVDSVGLITARNGIVVGSGITLSKDGDGFFTGVITATSYSGIDLSDVTGATGDFSIADKIIHTGDTDTLIRFPSADNIQFDVAGVERLRVDNSDGVIAKHTTAANLRIQNSTAASSQTATLDMAPANGVSGVQLKCTSEEDFSTGANRTAFFTMDVRKDGTFSERLRMDSSGRLLIGTTTEGEASADNLTIADSGNTGITIRSGTTSYGLIYFSDATSGTGEYDGAIEYKHDDNFMVFRTAASERLRILSNGRVAIGNATNNAAAATIFGVIADDGEAADLYVGQFKNLEATAGQSYGLNVQAGSNSTDHGFRVMNRANDTTQFLVRGDGRIGIGDASPDALLVIKGDSDSATTPSIRLKDGSDTRECWITNNSGDLMLVNGGDDNTPHCKITLLDGNLMTFATANTERMRLTSSGALNIATSSDTGIFLNVNQPNATGGHSVHLKAGASSSYSSAFACRVTCHGFYTNSYNNGGILFVNEDDTSHNRNAQAARFLNNDGTNVGAVLFNTSSTSYSTSSDYRLKENETPISDAITRLKTLKPYRFNFKATPSETIDGFFAHEVTTVPNAITGTKDQVDSDGNPLYQSMDHAKLVPLLTAALQEAVARIEALEG